MLMLCAGCVSVDVCVTNVNVSSQTNAQQLILPKTYDLFSFWDILNRAHVPQTYKRPELCYDAVDTKKIKKINA
jgi:hypothetical protein